MNDLNIEYIKKSQQPNDNAVSSLLEAGVDIASDIITIPPEVGGESLEIVSDSAEILAEGAAEAGEGILDSIGDLLDGDSLPIIAVIGIAISGILIVGGLIFGIIKLIKKIKNRGK